MGVFAGLDPVRYTLNGFALPTLLAAIALLALMVLVLVREGRTQTGRAFALIAMTAAMWLVCFSAMYCPRDEGAGLGWAKAAYGFIALIPAALYQFGLMLTGAAERSRVRRHVAGPLIAYDARNRIRFANPAACALLELDEGALAGLPIEALIDGRSPEDERLREALIRREAHHAEGGLRNRHGARIDVRVAISPLLSPFGPPAGAVVIAEDVRETKAKEMAGARALEESEARFQAL